MRLFSRLLVHSSHHFPFRAQQIAKICELRPQHSITVSPNTPTNVVGGRQLARGGAAETPHQARPVVAAERK
jgi:hypothetical protein